MAGTSLFGIGVSALRAFQSGLDTTGQNIANVNTPYYSRQEAMFEQRPPQFSAAGVYVGSGVDVQDIRRIYDQFVVNQVQNGTSTFQQTDTYYSFATQVDNLMADEQSGLTPGLQNFFNAVQEVANDPTSTAARQVLLTEGQSLVSRFRYLYDRLEAIRADANGRIAGFVDEINGLADSLAKINQDIVIATGRANGKTPNDLLDQRDALLGKLSELVAVRTVAQDDGSLNVFIGNGQALVVGNRANRLSADPLGLDVTEPDISIDNNGTLVRITDHITGGKLGGVLAFRGEILDRAENALGRVAAGLAADFNARHRLGMDLNGALGQDFFRAPAPEVIAATGNAGTPVTVTISDTNQLTIDDYELRYDGANWTFYRVSDNQVVPHTGTGTAVDPFVVNGISVVLGGGYAAGDRFLIRPVRQAARDIDTRLTDPREIAAAGAVTADTPVTNVGSGLIGSPTVLDATDPNLLNNVTITFTSPTTFDVFDNTTATPLAVGVAYNPADPADVLAYNGWQVELSGAPATGDSFTVRGNAGGVGDNRNALALAGLQQAQVLAGGTATYSDAYNEMIGDVGTSTRRAEITSQAQKKLLDDAIRTREGISGVNLDEEAANLLKFQQAYQAAAQVIATADSLFQTLIDAVRR